MKLGFRSHKLCGYTVANQTENNHTRRSGKTRAVPETVFPQQISGLTHGVCSRQKRVIIELDDGGCMQYICNVYYHASSWQLKGHISVGKTKLYVPEPFTGVLQQKEKEKGNKRKVVRKLS